MNKNAPNFKDISLEAQAGFVYAAI